MKNVYFNFYFIHIFVYLSVFRVGGPPATSCPASAGRGRWTRRRSRGAGPSWRCRGRGRGCRGAAGARHRWIVGGGPPSQSCSTLMQVFSKSTWQQVAKYKWM